MAIQFPKQSTRTASTDASPSRARRALIAAGNGVAGVTILATAACGGTPGTDTPFPTATTENLRLQTPSTVFIDKHEAIDCATAGVMLPTTRIVVKAEDSRGKPVSGQELRLKLDPSKVEGGKDIPVVEWNTVTGADGTGSFEVVTYNPWKLDQDCLNSTDGKALPQPMDLPVRINVVEFGEEVPTIGTDVQLKPR